MPYPRGYRIYEPVNPFVRDPASDRLVKILVENGSGTIAGADYYNPSDNIISWTENDTSIYLNAGDKEYRYIVPFDDQNDGSPSLVFSLINLVPPSDLTLTSLDYDIVKVNFTNVLGANEYTIKFRKLLDSSTIEQVIANNENVIGLEANTGYEVSIKATNSSNDSTEYSVTNPAFVTIKYFTLTSTVTSRGITWEVNYSIDGNTAYFEIINENGDLIADLGLNTQLTQSNIPVNTYLYFARLHNYDSTIRDSKKSEAIVYHDVLTSNLYNNSTYTDDLFKIRPEEDAYKNFNDLFEYEDTIYVDNINNYLNYEQPWKDWTFECGGYLDEAFFRDNKFQNASEVSITNENIVDKYIYIHGNYNDFQQRSYATNVNIVNNYKDITYTDFSNYNNYKNNINFEMAFSSIEFKKYFPVDEALKHDYSSIFSLENLNYTQARDTIQPITAFSWSYTDKFTLDNNIYENCFQTFSYHNDIGKDIKYLLDGLKIGISNDHKVGSAPPKFVYSNDYNLHLTRVRDALYNPIKPFDIDNKDIVWNQINKDINLVSQVNRVRILCVGDSITAGAPQYDPNYAGGTIWMSDLISGKFVTRMNPESTYPYWLQLKLGVDDYEVINQGFGRQYTENVLKDLPKHLNNHKPQYVMCLVGTNNIWDVQDKSQDIINNTVERALMDLRQIAETILHFGARPIIGTNLPRNSIVPKRAKDALRAINAGIKQLGTELDFEVIDWYDTFVLKDWVNGEWVENGTLNYALSGDDTHPNVVGYRTMADRINLAIFTSFRADFKVFRNFYNDDVDLTSEEPKVTPSRNVYNYNLTLPIMRRLQSYTINRYIKNVGNSWGLYILEVIENENMLFIWDDRQKKWVKTLTGRLSPSDIYHLRLKFITPSFGKRKNVQLKLQYIEFRR